MKNRPWTEVRDEIIQEQAVKPKRVKPLTDGQSRYFKAIETSVVTICTGPAGCGKSWLPCGLACQMLAEGRISKIVLTRPMAECDEKMGAMPGDLHEKVNDSMRPMLDALEEFTSPKELAKLIKDGQVLIVPLAKMRGRTFKNALVLLDEAQNCTYRQLRMFLTRLGQNSRMIVAGDHTQSDLPHKGENPLLTVIRRFSSECHPSISIVRLTEADIVRHELIGWMDRRLTKSEGERDAVGIACPECKKVFYAPVWAIARNRIIECCHCKGSVEPCDASGAFDPVGVDEEPECKSLIKI